MISVSEAEKTILAHTINLSIEECPTPDAIGRVLREDIQADRDFPPFDRVTMDGITINYQYWKNGQKKFLIEGVQTAGSPPFTLQKPDSALEIMTGAMLPTGCDVVIPVEEITFEEKDGKKFATINTPQLIQRQNIHAQGEDRKKGDILVPANTLLSQAEIAVAVSVGKSTLKVTQKPKIAIVSTGNELVGIDETPEPYQIRRSNSYALASALSKIGIKADIWHLPDDQQLIEEKMSEIFRDFDVIITSGGVSKGKKDFVPWVMEKLQVSKIFHRIKQRPGKPLWFGKKDNKVVFGLPGNPVSTMVGLFRYVMPYLREIEGIERKPLQFTVLSEDFSFDRDLTYFLSVKIINKEGRLWAKPIPGHGSGDFANLLDCDAFVELPAHEKNFLAGSVYPLIPFRNI
ncbi:MAG TPA: molybdopterin molybdenumtransferase MoeA [Microscillaceae bacterium]|nr:molybdopterin molybdenumtransferase MoeA [Microscillaceae bacterium]